MKEYIQHVYQSYAKFTPVPKPGFVVIPYPKQLREDFSFGVDPETGLVNQYKPNWFGGKTKTLGQGIADYIFENVNVPLGNYGSNYPNYQDENKKKIKFCQ